MKEQKMKPAKEQKMIKFQAKMPKSWKCFALIAKFPVPVGFTVLPTDTKDDFYLGCAEIFNGYITFRLMEEKREMLDLVKAFSVIVDLENNKMVGVVFSDMIDGYQATIEIPGAN